MICTVVDEFLAGGQRLYTASYDLSAVALNLEPLSSLPWDLHFAGFAFIVPVHGNLLVVLISC